MRDFNFFENYQVKKERKRKIVVLVFALICVLGLAGFAIFTVYYSFELRLRSLRMQADANERFLTSQTTIDSLAKHTRLNNQLNSIQLYNTTAALLEEQLISNSYIKTDLLKEIERSIPKDTRIDSLSFAGTGEISIAGVSEKKTSIAEFEYNLRELDFVDSVFVSGISLVEDKEMYGFSMSVSIKEVVNNERNK